MRKALVRPDDSSCLTPNNSVCSNRKEWCLTRTDVAICNSSCSFRKPDLRNPETQLYTNVNRRLEEKSDEFRTYATRSLRSEPAALFRRASNGDHHVRAAQLPDRAKPRRRSWHRR